jgi:hypothetical protein
VSGSGDLQRQQLLLPHSTSARPYAKQQVFFFLLSKAQPKNAFVTPPNLEMNAKTYARSEPKARTRIFIFFTILHAILQCAHNFMLFTNL